MALEHMARAGEEGTRAASARTPPAGPIGLYVHVPFCQTKCPYCDFNTYARIERLMPGYTDALCAELGLWGEALGRPAVRTVFFGGGTPSYLPVELLGRILGAVGAAFAVEEGAEVTVEANPGDLDLASLGALRALGVDRLSIGVQSFDDHFLRALGRRHSAAQAEEAYRLARRAGFRRVNLDLMFGLPEQSLEDWAATLERALALAPPHLSLYCLTLEPGTPLERWVREGRVPQPDPDLAAELYALAEERLEAAGYHHYEISNWALPGEECRHNLIYWRNEAYLGVGAGAHSSLGGYRFHDTLSPRSYIERVRRWAAVGARRLETLDAATLAGLGPVEGVEAISRDLEMAETVFLGLRLLDGLELEVFRRRFGVGLRERYGPQVAELEELGLLEEVPPGGHGAAPAAGTGCPSGGVLRLTRRGHLLANQVFLRFLE